MLNEVFQSWSGFKLRVEVQVLASSLKPSCSSIRRRWKLKRFVLIIITPGAEDPLCWESSPYLLNPLPNQNKNTDIMIKLLHLWHLWLFKCHQVPASYWLKVVSAWKNAKKRYKTWRVSLLLSYDVKCNAFDETTAIFWFLNFWVFDIVQAVLFFSTVFLSKKLSNLSTVFLSNLKSEKKSMVSTGSTDLDRVPSP